MARVMLIGAGGVAGVAAAKMAQNPDVFGELLIASRTKARCDAIKANIERLRCGEVERLKGCEGQSRYLNPSTSQPLNISTAQLDAMDVAATTALIKAYKFTQENREGTVKDVKKYIDIEEDLINTEVYGGYSVSSPDPDKKGTVTLKETIVELGYTDDFDIEPHYNTDIYKKALDSILAEGSDDIYASLKEHFDDYE